MDMGRGGGEKDQGRSTTSLGLEPFKATEAGTVFASRGTVRTGVREVRVYVKLYPSAFRPLNLTVEEGRT